MKFSKAIVSTMIIGTCLTACGNQQKKQSEMDKTPEAYSMLNVLEKLPQHKMFMFGHHDDPVYGIGWDGDENRSDVKSVCGDYPAMMSFDLGRMEIYGDKTLDNVSLDRIRKEVIAQYERGGMSSFSWHVDNPLTGKDSWDVSDSTVVKSVLPGGVNHDKFIGWLDKVADYLNSIQTSEGVKVPVLFRPWHEHTGSWFWWGKNLCSTEDYKALWRMTYDRLQEKGATQLLYAYSPGTEPKDSTEYLERYPGDDIVDLIGVDAYQFDKDAYVKSLDNALTIMSQVSKAHKKLMAVTETGYETIPDSLWWTQTLMPVIEKYPISYVLVWRNARERENHYYAPYPGHPSAADFVNFYNDPRTLFAGDMKTIKLIDIKLIIMNTTFEDKVKRLFAQHEELITRKNEPVETTNGVYTRYKYPVVTAAHTPVFWRYDLDEKTNPYLMERIGMNAAMNSGAIKWNGKYLLVVRVEGADRKSFFAVAESPNGVDNFRFWDYPITMPDDVIPATNIYDMRLTAHEDGWIYGIFCAERHDDNAPAGDLSSATATAAIARTKDLKTWERLPDLKSKSQQRNVVLHPEFVDGKYAFYTRPQDGFIDAGSGGGIGWALVDDITHAEVKEEKIIDCRYYHTIKEVKNGEGPHPIKTPKGWLHLAHGVRGCAAGLRYVLYMYMTSLEDPSKLIAAPGGYFMAPEGEERIGDVSNVLFTNGWIADEDGKVFIYYASSDTRMHVAVSTIDKLVDYCMNTPQDGLTTTASVETLKKLIDKNLKLIK